MIQRLRGRTPALLGIALLVGLLLALVQARGLYPRIEQGATDDFYAFQGADRYGDYVSQKLAIVAIDDRTLAELGRFTDWDRGIYAQMIQRLQAAGARVI